MNSPTFRKWSAVCGVIFSTGLGLGAGWHTGSWIPGVCAALAGVVGCWTLARSQDDGSADDMRKTLSSAWSPDLLAVRRQSLVKEQAVLEDTQEFQRSVFEVSAELVGCVDEADARVRFTAALRRYWACTGGDLMVWDRGTWRSLGGDSAGPPPELTESVQLPGESGDDLILDLSAGIAGKGALILRQARPQPSLLNRSDDERRQVAEILQSQLALSLRRVLLYSQLKALARVDPLTGTHRRWYGESRLKELLKAGGNIAVIMVDIDHFKRVNDTFGHSAGDQVLGAVGRTLTGLLRPSDLICRFGGEEFLVILAGTDPGAALVVAERLRVFIADLSDLPAPVTMSLGVASWAPNEPLYDLVARADTAMYQAKHEGRNRVSVAPAPSDENSQRITTRRIKPGEDSRLPTPPR